MKLPRLGNPTTQSSREMEGENEVTTRITSGSQFDMLPAWAQWLIALIVVGLFGAMGFCLYLQH